MSILSIKSAIKVTCYLAYHHHNCHLGHHNHNCHLAHHHHCYSYNDHHRLCPNHQGHRRSRQHVILFMIITTLLFLYNLLTIKITENLLQEDSGNYSCHLPSASLSVTASLQILKGGCFSLTFKIYQTSARIFHQSTEMNIFSKLTFLIFS